MLKNVYNGPKTNGTIHISKNKSRSIKFKIFCFFDASKCCFWCSRMGLLMLYYRVKASKWLKMKDRCQSENWNHAWNYAAHCKTAVTDLIPESARKKKTFLIETKKFVNTLIWIFKWKDVKTFFSDNTACFYEYMTMYKSIYKFDSQTGVVHLCILYFF